MDDGKMPPETSRLRGSLKLGWRDDVQGDDDAVRAEHAEQFLKGSAAGGTLEEQLAFGVAVAGDGVEVPASLVRDAKRPGQHPGEDIADWRGKHQDCF